MPFAKLEQSPVFAYSGLWSTVWCSRVDQSVRTETTRLRYTRESQATVGNSILSSSGTDSQPGSRTHHLRRPYVSSLLLSPSPNYVLLQNTDECAGGVSLESMSRVAESGFDYTVQRADVAAVLQGTCRVSLYQDTTGPVHAPTVTYVLPLTGTNTRVPRLYHDTVRSSTTDGHTPILSFSIILVVICRLRDHVQ